MPRYLHDEASWGPGMQLGFQDLRNLKLHPMGNLSSLRSCPSFLNCPSRISLRCFQKCVLPFLISFFFSHASVNEAPSCIVSEIVFSMVWHRLCLLLHLLWLTGLDQCAYFLTLWLMNRCSSLADILPVFLQHTSSLSFSMEIIPWSRMSHFFWSVWKTRCRFKTHTDVFSLNHSMISVSQAILRFFASSHIPTRQVMVTA